MTDTSTKSQPGSPEWLAEQARPVPAPQPPRGDAGWKIGTFVFGTATIVLSILLAGQLMGPRVVYETAPPAATPTSEPSTAPEVEAPEISDVSAQVGELGLVMMQSYSADSGWPENVTVTDGSAKTSDGIVLGEVPDGWKLSYERAADGSGFVLTLEDTKGESAVFGPSVIDP